MGWLSGPRIAKDAVSGPVPSGMQGRMVLDPFGAATPNLAGQINPDGSYPGYAKNGYGRNELVYACFDGDTAVALADGTLRRIADVRPGDVVRSHKGKSRTVTGSAGRAHTGTLLTIRRASASRRLIVTPEHPFFVGRGTRNGEIAYSWVEAGDLRLNTPGSNPPDGDWLVEPVPGELTDLDEFVITRDVPGTGKRSNRHWARWVVRVDAGLLRLAGYFLAEGFCNGRSVRFAFHEDEHDYHADVTDLMAEHFGARLSDYPGIANGRTRVLTFNSVKAVEFFAQFGRGAKNKVVPPWILALPPDKQRHLIAGAWRGDGSADRDRYTLASAGRDLIEAYRLMLLRLGICARLTTITRRSTLPGGREFDSVLHQLAMTGEQMRLFADRLGLPRRGDEPTRPRVSAFIRNGYAHWRVLDVHRREVADYPVYNLEVEADNSYLADGVAAHNCIRYRAESLPQSVLRVYPAGLSEPLDDHRLRRLFENPNPVTDEFEFFELSVTYKDLAGTCFWMVVNGRDGLPSQIWPLRPDLVGVLPSGVATPANPTPFTWIYRPDPSRPDLAVPIPDAGDPAAARSPAYMIRIRYPNPNPDDPGWRYFGQPPLRPAARATTLDNAATDFVDTLLRNHAMPATVVETEKEITQELHERLRSRWRQAFGGAHRGEPAFLQKGMKVHQLSLTLTDLEFPDLRAVSESRICGVFGVEPILVGAKIGLEHNAYKDYREARLSFWEEAMFSEQRRFIEPVRSRLLTRFVGRRRTRAEWDNSGVLALKEAETTRWERAVNALARGGITRNDFRVIVGLSPVPGGDVFLTPAGVNPTSAGGDAGDQAAAEAGSVGASLGMLAAEFGVELSANELSALKAREES